jgi:predicted transposase YdaD
MYQYSLQYHDILGGVQWCERFGLVLVVVVILPTFTSMVDESTVALEAIVKFTLN